MISNNKPFNQTRSGDSTLRAICSPKTANDMIHYKETLTVIGLCNRQGKQVSPLVKHLSCFFLSWSHHTSSISHIFVSKIKSHKSYNEAFICNRIISTIKSFECTPFLFSCADLFKYMGGIDSFIYHI